MSPRILKADDLYQYANGLRNSGVTGNFLALTESQALVRLFGREGAAEFLDALDNETPAAPVSQLVEGDGVTFHGVRAILAISACLTLVSQGRMQTGRQNVGKQPVQAKAITMRDDYETVQALAGMARFQIRELVAWLKIDNNNPLGLTVKGTIRPQPYAVDSSGRIPAGWSFWGFGL